AGWDTRLYSLVRPAKPDMCMYEVDAVNTQMQKRRALETAKIDTTGVVFAAADFNKESWLDALVRVGFDPAKPTFILWEGVTYYLEAAAVESTLQTVAQQLAQGSLIAFDYPAKHIIGGEGSRFYRAAMAAAERIGEPWQFGIPTEAPARDKLEAFLAENGLRLTAYEVIGDLDKDPRAHGGLALAVNN
ncbi:MAG: class I SAM-dependent methyltransferase, partial [Chloroflexi bacterium]|nr:class I SAM-dependent methyltransferase [Chloroflexota bacterium]